MARPSGRILSEGLAAAQRAAARGSPVDEAAALAVRVQPQLYLLRTAEGLEQALERELHSLGVRGSFSAYRGGVAMEAPEEAFWHVALNSRIMESGRICLTKPFHAAYESTLRNYSSGVTWSDFLNFGAFPSKPQIKVSVDGKSRLFHTKLVEHTVASVIEEQRQRIAKEMLQRSSDADFYSKASQAPMDEAPVFVDIQNNECTISMAVTEARHRRAYTLAAEASRASAMHSGAPAAMGYEEEQLEPEPADVPQEEARRPRKGDAGLAPLDEQHAAACVLRSPVLRHLTRVAKTGQKLVVWDPFGGSGVILLETLGICMGVPPASPAMPMPFTTFPHFNETVYAEAVRSIRIDPHPALPFLELVASHRDARELAAAEENLQGFIATVPRPRAARADILAGRLPCAVTLRRVKRMDEMVPELRGKPTVIVTNVPYGNKVRCRNIGKVYEEFGLVVRDLAQHGNLLAVLCVSSREEFKRSTNLEWRTELRFSREGIKLELLQWTGRTTDVTTRSNHKKRAKKKAAKHDPQKQDEATEQEAPFPSPVAADAAGTEAADEATIESSRQGPGSGAARGGDCGAEAGAR